MIARPAFALCATLSLFSSACGPLDDAGLEGEAAFDEADLARDESAIEVGTNDASSVARDAVVLIGGGCTGTLVAPTVVLTAAHCGFTDEAYADGNWHNLPAPLSIYFGPDRNAPRHTAVATQVSTPPLVRDPWPEDIALLRLNAAVPAAIATPRGMLVDRPAGLSSASVIYQVGYGGGRNRRYMTGRGYSDWTGIPAQLMNGFVYTADSRGAGIGDRDTNIEGGDSGGPMLFGSVLGPVMGDLSHWNPYGIATFGPGNGVRPSIRAWLQGKAPQRPDFRVAAIQPYGCTGSGGEPVVGVTVRNDGTISASVRVDAFVNLAAAPAMGTLSALNRNSALIAPGGTQTLSFPVSRDYQLRRIRVDAIVDTRRVVNETNEANNVANSWVTLGDCSFN